MPCRNAFLIVNHIGGLCYVPEIRDENGTCMRRKHLVLRELHGWFGAIAARDGTI